MKILSCITKFDEISLLKNVGVDEIYFAVSWLPNYGNVGTISDFYQFQRIVLRCNKLGINYHLALNSFKIRNIDVEMLKRTLNYNLRSVIISDISLAIFIKNMFPYIQFHISSVFNVLNLSTLKFLKKLLGNSLKRIIFPNQLSALEALPLLKWCKKNNIETEIFSFRHFGCPYINGYCSLHGEDYLDISLTEEGNNCRYGSKLLKVKIEKITGDNKLVLKRLRERLICGKIPRILNASSFFDFYFYGVDFVKYGTRTASTMEKIEAVKFLKKIVLLLDKLSVNFSKEKAKKLFLDYTSF